MLPRNIPINLHYIRWWAGSVGCMQAITYMVLTLLGILFYSDVILLNDSNNLTLSNALKNTYFKATNETQTVWSPLGLLVYNSIYLLLSCIWLLASILLIIPVQNNNWKTVAKLYNWIVTTIIICILDLVAGILFAIDYGNPNKNRRDDKLMEMLESLASIVMMIVAFKGFILWLINVILVAYLIHQIVIIQRNNKNISQLFNFAKNTEGESTSSTQSLKMERNTSPQAKSNVIRAYSNACFEPDKAVETNTVEAAPMPELNGESLIRAARSSIFVAAQERRFRNLDAYVQYPPRPSVNHPAETPAMQHPPTPMPDYTPPLKRNLHIPHNNTNYKYN